MFQELNLCGFTNSQDKQNLDVFANHTRFTVYPAKKKIFLKLPLSSWLRLKAGQTHMLVEYNNLGLFIGRVTCYTIGLHV